MSKLSELAGLIEGVNTRLDKVKTEVQALRDSLGDVEIPASAQASLDKLAALAQAIDEINPDAAPPA